MNNEFQANIKLPSEKLYTQKIISNSMMQFLKKYLIYLFIFTLT